MTLILLYTWFLDTHLQDILYDIVGISGSMEDRE